MSAITDLLLATTDPVTALMLIGLAAYIRSVKNSIRSDVKRVRNRVGRLEDSHIPDGGRILEDE